MFWVKINMGHGGMLLLSSRKMNTAMKWWLKWWFFWITIQNYWRSDFAVHESTSIYIYICIICNIIDGSLSMIHGYIIDAWWIFKLELYPPQFCDDPWPCWALMTSLFSHLDSRDWGYKKNRLFVEPQKLTPVWSIPNNHQTRQSPRF